MPDPILCHECGHDIDEHDIDHGDDCGCFRQPSAIAHAYGEKRFDEGWAAHELRWAVRHSE